MKPWKGLALPLISWLLVASMPLVAELDNTNAVAALDKLKSLAGNWEGQSDDGKPVHTSFQVTSAGVTLLQMIQPSGWPEKPTLYHLDGNTVMLTHYCSANNQPRMRATPAPGAIQELRFVFVDVTNLRAATAGHMHEVIVVFQDQDHFTQKWAWRENGKDTWATFHFARKK